MANWRHKESGEMFRLINGSDLDNTMRESDEYEELTEAQIEKAVAAIEKQAREAQPADALEAMSVGELNDIAKAREIEGWSTMKKAELVAAIREAGATE